jgi:hypothetical protein
VLGRIAAPGGRECDSCLAAVEVGRQLWRDSLFGISGDSREPRGTVRLLTNILLVAIALLLFYKLVERRHKILLGKVLGALALVTVLVVAALSLGEQARFNRDHQRLASVSVKFVAPRQGSADVRHWNGAPDTVNSVSFALCNSGNQPVESVSFDPTTYRANRSTPYQLPIAPLPYQDRVLSALTSDYVIPPKNCVTLTWTGWYQVFDSVSVRVAEVRFATP